MNKNKKNELERALLSNEGRKMRAERINKRIMKSKTVLERMLLDDKKTVQQIAESVHDEEPDILFLSSMCVFIDDVIEHMPIEARNRLDDFFTTASQVIFDDMQGFLNELTSIVMKLNNKGLDHDGHHYSVPNNT